MNIPFNIPFVSGQELFYLKTALQSGHFSSEGLYIDRCKEWLGQKYSNSHLFLTTSCTHALEMASLLIDIKFGEEVIIPSWTHVSTANAFAMRGAKIVFADIDAETMTVDVKDVENKITKKTKAVVAVHYGGYYADVVQLKKICEQNNVYLIEDAAHSIGAGVDGFMQGCVGHLGCISFHSSKNIHCGEGGLLLVNDKKLQKSAEIVFDKGTDRYLFLQNKVSNYQWRSIGSSFSMSNITASVLLAQLQEVDNVNNRRRELWDYYFEKLSNINSFEKCFSLPVFPKNFDEFNAHIFFIKATDSDVLKEAKRILINNGIQVASHYFPLHESSFGSKYSGKCPITSNESKILIRLPMFYSITYNQINFIANIFEKAIGKLIS